MTLHIKFAPMFVFFNWVFVAGFSYHLTWLFLCVDIYFIWKTIKQKGLTNSE